MDASIWISAFVAVDVGHHSSLAWLREHVDKSQGLLVPSLALAEVAGAVSRRSGRTQDGLNAVARMQRIPGLVIVALAADLMEDAFWVASQFRIKGADAVYAAAARYLACGLATRDRELAHRLSGTLRVELLP